MEPTLQMPKPVAGSTTCILPATLHVAHRLYCTPLSRPHVCSVVTVKGPLGPLTVVPTRSSDSWPAAQLPL